jgi:hypothetical protein
MSDQPEQNFSITIEGQPVNVLYCPNYFVTADYAHFEFTSPQEGRRIPMSTTGYRSHFSPMWEVREAPSIEEYIHQLAHVLTHAKAAPEPEDDDEDDRADEGQQLSLF